MDPSETTHLSDVVRAHQNGTWSDLAIEVVAFLATYRPRQTGEHINSFISEFNFNSFVEPKTGVYKVLWVDCF